MLLEVIPHGIPVTYYVPVRRPMPATITEFIVHARGDASQPANAYMVVGNLHIVCGRLEQCPSLLTRQRIVKLLRTHLDTFIAPHPNMPIVRIIVGEDYLTTQKACEALQRERNENPPWVVYPAVVVESLQSPRRCSSACLMR